MRKNRVTRKKVEMVWQFVTDALARSPKLRGGMKVPDVDIDEIFAGRKSMTIDAVVGAISQRVNMANG